MEVFVYTLYLNDTFSVHGAYPHTLFTTKLNPSPIHFTPDFFPHWILFATKITQYTKTAFQLSDVKCTE